MTDNNTETSFKANVGTGFLFVPTFTLSEGQKNAGLVYKGYIRLDQDNEIKITCFEKTGKKGKFLSIQVDRDEKDEKISELETKMKVLESKLDVIPVVKEEPEDSEDHPM